MVAVSYCILHCISANDLMVVFMRTLNFLLFFFLFYFSLLHRHNSLAPPVHTNESKTHKHNFILKCFFFLLFLRSSLLIVRTHRHRVFTSTFATLQLCVFFFSLLIFTVAFSNSQSSNV